MKIPIGNQGFNVASAERGANANPEAFGAGIGNAMQRVGNAGMQIVGDMRAQEEQIRREQEQAAKEKQREDEALARAKAANSMLDHEINVKTTRQQIEEGMTDGSINYEEAEKTFNESLQKMEKPSIEYADPIINENLDKGIKRINFVENFGLQSSVNKARKADHKTQTDSAIDKLGKLAGMPNADVALINEKAAALDTIGKSAYGQSWDKKKQDFVDANWTNHAVNHVAMAADNIEVLKRMQYELTDSKGFYADKLDADKRSAILRSVIGDINRVENKALHETDKREAKAERLIGDIDKQISTGVQATVEQWAEWADKVKGTAAEPLFKDRIQAEVIVQEVLRKPINEQLSFVQQQEQALATNGGSIQAQANVARMRKAVDNNIKQLADNPLQYNQTKTGAAVPPLDLMSLGNANGAAILHGQINDRFSALQAMRKQYGDVVKIKPFMPQEVQQIGQVLQKSSPKQQVQLFGTLHNAFDDEAGYMAAMQQIAPDAPVKSFAGLLYAKQKNIALKGGDVASADIAETMLIGEDILNKSKEDKAGDGKPKNFPLPPEADFRKSFSDFAGSVFAGRTGAYEMATQAVRSYYTGLAAKEGDITGEIDSKRMKQAVKAVMGTVVDVNGNGDVLAPWGMDEDEFEGKAKTAFDWAVTRHKLPPETTDKWRAFGMQYAGDSKYYVTQGRSYLTDSKGAPIILDLNQSPPPEVIKKSESGGIGLRYGFQK